MSCFGLLRRSRSCGYGFLPVALVLTLTACQQAPQAPPAPPRVDAPNLQLAIVPLPEDFAVETNDGTVLALRPSEEDSSGRIWFEVGPADPGSINLVDVVNSQKGLFEAMPNGEFFGSRPLQTPEGKPAYYSRGRFDEAGSSQEEIRVFQIHPSAYRLLAVHYRFPAVDDEESAARLRALLTLLGSMEGLGGDTASPDEATPEEAS